VATNATTSIEGKKAEEKSDKDDKKRSRRQADSDQKDEEASDLSLDAQGVSSEKTLVLV